MPPYTVRMHIRWLTAFLDFPAEQFGSEVTFWRAIAGSTASPPRGAHREFASLEPFNGDPHLRVQRIDDGPGGTHLDFHTGDPRAAATGAINLGARMIRDAGEWLTMESPGGFPFCFVRWQGESRRSRPIRWPGDTISIIDQVTLDIPATMFDQEAVFWTRLTGWTAEPTDRPEFLRLRRDPGLTIGILLQRLGSDSPARTVHAHVDLAATVVDDEVARHEGWGATVLDRHPDFTVMSDPIGRRYCITSRNPRTGLQ